MDDQLITQTTGTMCPLKVQGCESCAKQKFTSPVESALEFFMKLTSCDNVQYPNTPTACAEWEAIVHEWRATELV